VSCNFVFYRDIHPYSQSSPLPTNPSNQPNSLILAYGSPFWDLNSLTPTTGPFFIHEATKAPPANLASLPVFSATYPTLPTCAAARTSLIGLNPNGLTYMVLDSACYFSSGETIGQANGLIAKTKDPISQEEILPA